MSWSLLYMYILSPLCTPNYVQSIVCKVVHCHNFHDTVYQEECTTAWASKVYAAKINSGVILLVHVSVTIAMQNPCFVYIIVIIYMWLCDAQSLVPCSVHVHVCTT